MLRASLACLALLLVAAPTIAAEPAPTALPSRLLEWTPGLDLLHAGRIDQALALFEERWRARPHDPCGAYFQALVYTSFDVDGLLRAREVELGREWLERGIQVGQRRLEAEPRDDGARYCQGALHGLRAAERLEQDKFVAAAFDAKKARRIMLDLLEDRPACIDCRFWVGSYDYFADVLPGVIKFFRTLMFFPKGDRERGLATLEEVSRRGKLDRYNALWVLQSVYMRLENDPQRSYKTLQQVLETYPDCTDAYLAMGWLHEVRTLGIELHLEALERLGAPSDATGTMRIKASVSLARLYLRDLQPESAVNLLKPLHPTVRDSVDRDLRVGSVLARALNHAGRHAEALRVLAGLRERHPGHEEVEKIARAVLDFDAASSRTFSQVVKAWRTGQGFDALRDAGHDAGLVHFGEASMHFDLGEFPLAERHFRLAVDAGLDRPKALLPLAYIRLGNLLDLRGERRSAKSYYRKASSAAGESELLQAVAKRYLKEPSENKPGDLRYP